MLRLLAAISLAVAVCGQTPIVPDVEEQIDQILHWLPEDTETVLVSQRPFAIELDEPVAPDVLWDARAYLLGPLFLAWDEEFLKKELQGRTLRFALVAARQFRRTTALGYWNYQGCGVYVFSEPLAVRMRSTERQEVIQDQTIWISSRAEIKRRSEPASQVDHFTALIEPDRILVCSDHSFLTSVLTRRQSGASRVALPPSLPEWAQLDRSAPIWGLHHLPPNFDDPIREELFAHDPEATGVVVQIGTSRNRIQARWLSKGTNPWQEFLTFSEAGNKAQTASLSPGVWQMTMASDDGETVAEIVFLVMALLGFAINL